MITISFLPSRFWLLQFNTTQILLEAFNTHIGLTGFLELEYLFIVQLTVQLNNLVYKFDWNTYL